ncbi:oligosaccharide flippase family protein [candidate division WOR-3 bacterium]|nr:oligosaccharide flippase family protein [candidate division WOR-3 bacterium]
MEVGKQISKGAMYIGGGKVATLLINTLSVTLIPRILGPESMGFYSYWLSVYFILITILDFGATSILVRYIPELIKTNIYSIRPLIKKVIQIKFPMILLIILVGAFLFSRERMFFYTILLASVLHTIIFIERRILYTYKNMRKYSLVEFVRITIRLLLILWLFFLFKNPGILLAILLSTLLVSLIFGIPALKLIPKTSGTLTNPFRDYLSFGLFLYLANTFTLLIPWLVVIFSRNYIDNIAVVGFLGLGIQICFGIIAHIVYTLGESIFPSLVEFHITNDVRFNKSLELYWKYTNLVLIPLITGLFILASPIVSIVIGEKYLPSIAVVKLLLPGVVFMLWTHVYRQILVIFERKVAIFIGQLLGFLGFMSSIFFFLKNYGIAGASISVSLGMFITFIYIYLASLRIEKIPSKILHVLKPLLSSVIMCFVISFIKIDNPTFLIGTIVLGMLIYFVVMVVIKGITRVDIQRIKVAFQ